MRLIFLLLGSLLLASDSDLRFQDLVAKEWQFRIAIYPDLAAAEQTDKAVDFLEDASIKASQDRVAYWKSILSEFDKIDLQQLTHENRINAAIFREQLKNNLLEIELFNYLMPINSDTAFYSYLPQLPSGQAFATSSDYEAYLKKLASFPKYFADHRERMDVGIAKGYTMPQVILKGRDSALQVHAQVADPQKSLYYTPFLEMPASMPESEQASLRAKAKEIIQKDVIETYKAFILYFNESYVPKCRQTLAASLLPNGDAFYRAQIRNYTTLDLSPEEIHNKGLAEVARIHAEMMDILKELSFNGDFAAFLNFLRTDSQFYAKTPHELLSRARDICKRIDYKLPAYFKILPRQTYGVEPVPDDIAPSYTAGRYVGAPLGGLEAGKFWVNTSLLKSRPLYALPALALHESVPGHHLQGALAAEQGEQPPFRRYSYISAYGEGWALYCEHLGVEMGIYETPYEHFGRLTYEMWRACRLVVDTGIHAKMWTRAQAVKFMTENTALSNHEIETEIDRYIGWPGQALSYKLGELVIRELRQEGEKALGSKFDLRDFHDRLLALGSVPLNVLESEMRAWIQAQKNP